LLRSDEKSMTDKSVRKVDEFGSLNS